MLAENTEIECDELEIDNEDEDSDFGINMNDYTTKSLIRCICPKCDKKHYLKLFWTGSGTPRVYCHRCREAISNICDCAIYESQPDVYRISRSGVGVID